MNEALERVVSSKDWITGIFFIALLCLVFARWWFQGRFLNFIILPFNNKYVMLYNKKGRLLSGFHMTLTLFQLLNLALFVFFALQALELLPDFGEIPIYFIFLGGILGYILLKVLLQLASGFIFGNQKLIGSIIFNKLSYLNYSGIVLFVANLLLTYVWPGSMGIITLAAGLFFVINLVGYVGVLKIHQNAIASQFFYFILYLCALEIAPLLIISNLVNA
ncbi:protein of unknown function [Robiginitalea myxolifaciens]|uniref:DUF4271 domain-containing protein n=1 Tax=Robiginitalea myxolifaciens TaxID=400055 RepID=A0A1I6G8Q9_9FLAO|nr:DUF4271 domain-containing protein [Robiginitalea myxolifaciens]SFR38582.1 protein of unknown function [Robiginitalea myxolifaciens]